MVLSYNSEGSIAIPLPEGLANDSYKLTLYVKVIDDFEGISSYTVGTVTVLPNVTLTTELINQFFDTSGTNSVYQVLKSGNLSIVSQFIISMSIALDSQASSSATVVSTTNANVSQSTGVSFKFIFFKFKAVHIMYLNYNEKKFYRL